MAALDSNFLDDVAADEVRRDLAVCRVKRSQCRSALARDPGNAVLRLQVDAFTRWIERYERELAV